jgi:hypothetical protein
MTTRRAQADSLGAMPGSQSCRTSDGNRESQRDQSSRNRDFGREWSFEIFFEVIFSESKIPWLLQEFLGDSTVRPLVNGPKGMNNGHSRSLSLRIYISLKHCISYSSDVGKIHHACKSASQRDHNFR